jgi:hypothetical protein
MQPIIDPRTAPSTPYATQEPRLGAAPWHRAYISGSDDIQSYAISADHLSAHSSLQLSPKKQKLFFFCRRQRSFEIYSFEWTRSLFLKIVFIV